MQFRKLSVASVLSSFDKIIKQLDQIADREAAAAAGKGELLNKLGQEINEHQAERLRALKAADKIKGLIS